MYKKLSGTIYQIVEEKGTVDTSVLAQEIARLENDIRTINLIHNEKDSRVKALIDRENQDIIGFKINLEKELADKKKLLAEINGNNI